MAAKKREETYEPSQYQKAIFDYIEHEKGNLVVEAAAGSGKTYTLIKALGLIPQDKRVLMTAFNKDIVKELTKKVKGFPNVEVRTLHGLGMILTTRGLRIGGRKPEGYKYTQLIYNHWQDLTKTNIKKLARNARKSFVENTKKLVDFGRFYIATTKTDMIEIMVKYDIPCVADEVDVALQIMAMGAKDIENIDYTDMIWMPHIYDLHLKECEYDYIMVDECQDMNVAERKLVLRCLKEGGRLIAVGDSNQCIYGFSGSDPESFRAIQSLPNTVSMPLSISYRCPEAVVTFAKNLVPSIEAKPNAEEGVILDGVSIEDVQDGDMVLCRNNAPLLQVYCKLLEQGKKAYIRGSDVGKNLKSIVTSTHQEYLHSNLKQDGVFIRLYEDLFNSRKAIMERYGISQEDAMNHETIQNKLDMIRALEVLGFELKTAEQLERKIDEIFPKNDKGEGIMLSTIHKAKGLEADNVFIACASLMPSKSAVEEWQVKQERNLMYVAYTRAKKLLAFLDEEETPDFDNFSSKLESKLKYAETMVAAILGKSFKPTMNEAMAKSIVERAKARKIFAPIEVNTVSMENDKKEEEPTDLSFDAALRKPSKRRKITL